MRISATGTMLIGALLLAGCQMSIPFSTAPKRSENSRIARIEGTVAYRERIALAPDAVVTVTLVDLSSGLALATERFEVQERQVPMPFTIDYDPARIIEGGHYALHASIRDAKGATIWRDTGPFPLSFAGEPVTIMLVRATD